MSLSSEATFGFYHALGMTFDATPEALKKAFRKASLRCHPDRNPGDDAAKIRFQQINTAHACLSDPLKRAEYDAVLRMRSVLEQDALTDGTVRDAPLDLVYMFAMKQPGALGMREDVVLMVNLVEGTAKGRVERWRGGQAVDQRPLSTLRAIDVASTTSGPSLKAHFRVESGKASTLQLFARSASEVGTLAALLRALIADHAALYGGGDGNSFSQAAAEKAAERPLMLRVDDETMPPAPKLCAWLALKVVSAPSGSKLADFSGAAAAAFKGSTRVFALLGTSKLLLFADRLCAHLKQLITLEAGRVHVAHGAEQREFELSIEAAAAGVSGTSTKGKSLRFTLTAETAFEAAQWANKIEEALSARSPSASALPVPMDEPDPEPRGAASAQEGGAIAPASVPAAPSAPSTPAAPEKQLASLIAQLEAMGFASELCAYALQRSANDLQRAAVWLLDGGALPDAAAPEHATEAVRPQPANDTVAVGDLLGDLSTPPRGSSSDAYRPSALIVDLLTTSPHQVAALGPTPLCPATVHVPPAVDGEPVSLLDAATAPPSAAPAGGAFAELDATLFWSDSHLCATYAPAQPPAAAATAASSFDFLNAVAAAPSSASACVSSEGASSFDFINATAVAARGASNTAPSGVALSSGGGAVSARSSATQQLTLLKPSRDSRLGLDIEAPTPGHVVVCEVVRGSIADLAGLRTDDVLLRVGGVPVSSTDRAATLLSAAVGPIAVEVRRTDSPAALKKPAVPPAPTSAAPAILQPVMLIDDRSSFDFIARGPERLMCSA